MSDRSDVSQRKGIPLSLPNDYVDPGARGSLRRCVCVGVFCVTVAVVWGLLALLTVIYHTRPELCAGETYQGQVCRLPLLAQQSCLTGNPDAAEIHIPSRSSQQNLEHTLASGLQLFDPGPQCLAALAPFMCLYTLGLCDGSGVLHLPSLEECVYVRDTACAQEWASAAAVVGENSLPQCQSLPPAASLGHNCTITAGLRVGSNEVSSGETVPVPATVSEPPPSHSSCSAEVYEGKICVLALQLQQSYLQGREDDSTVYIESGRNALENATVSQLQNLAQLQPSEECSAAVVPFLCLYTFGLCDGNGTLHRPSSKQCMYIRNVTCKTEWDLAVAVVGEGALPHCHLLPDTTSLIQDSAPTGTATTQTSDSGEPSLPVCSDGFYVSSTGLCRPECLEWEEFPHAAVVVFDVFVVLQAVVYVIAATAVIILTCIRRKKMYRFPSGFVVFQVIPVGVFEVFVLIGYMDRKKLFCSSPDLIEALEHPTTFCNIQGAVFYYCSLVTSILWVCHILGVTWRVKFPVHARSFEQKSYFKYVYVAMIAIALTLPFGSIAASFATGGYGLPRFPPTTCLAIDPGASFYGFVIPVVAILGLGICAILALFCLLISTIQLRTGKMDLAKTGVKGYISSWLKKWRPEIKISVILIYFSLFLGTSQTALTFVIRNIPSYVSELETYFLCESSGQLPGKVCERSFQRLGWEIVIVIAYIILGCYPVVQLIYVVNMKDLKQELTREGSSIAALNPLSIHKPRMQKTSVSSDTHV